MDINREDLRWAALLTCVEVIADASLKAASQQENSSLSPIGGSLYVLEAYILQKAVMKNNLGIVNAAWNAGTTCTGVLTGMAFGEKYTTTQLLGVGFIAIGIFLI
jgi:multidrug transporter EmrE-like cation transporter